MHLSKCSTPSTMFWKDCSEPRSWCGTAPIGHPLPAASPAEAGAAALWGRAGGCDRGECRDPGEGRATGERRGMPRTPQEARVLRTRLGGAGSPPRAQRHKRWKSSRDRALTRCTVGPMSGRGLTVAEWKASQCNASQCNARTARTAGAHKWTPDAVVTRDRCRGRVQGGRARRTQPRLFRPLWRDPRRTLAGAFASLQK